MQLNSRECRVRLYHVIFVVRFLKVNPFHMIYKKADQLCSTFFFFFFFFFVATAVTYFGTSAQPILEPLMLQFWISGTWTASRVELPTLRTAVRHSTGSAIPHCSTSCISSFQISYRTESIILNSTSRR